jgi:hypothetical protein
MFAWFNTSEAVDLAKSLAAKIGAAVPPNQTEATKKKKVDKYQRMLREVLQHGTASVKAQNFNFYKKAKFLATLRLELSGRGYPEPWVRDIVKALMYRG